MLKYIYDAWGMCNVIILDESAAEITNLNPFRYRCYYYDEEIGLYYLQSRYAINFKLAVKHWLAVAVAVVCCIVPQLVPIAAYIVKLLSAAASVAKPILITALPLLLGV